MHTYRGTTDVKIIITEETMTNSYFIGTATYIFYVHTYVITRATLSVAAYARHIHLQLESAVRFEPYKVT